MTAEPGVPLISALMVTRGRLDMARRAIACFARQIWPCRQLTIVSDGLNDVSALRDAVWVLGDPAVVISCERDRYTLAAIRNIALDAAKANDFW